MKRRTFHGRFFGGALLGGGLALAGCERAAPPVHYEALGGNVLSRQADTGKFLVRITSPKSDERPASSLFCVATKDSEIYLNDQFCTIDVIQAGDKVELIGYRDPNAKDVEFVVSFVYISRDPLPVRVEGTPSAGQ